MGLRADSARPQRVSGSARIHSQRAESARNIIALHVKFGDDSALNTLTAAVHWERPDCGLAQTSLNLIWAAMGLRADSARPQRVSGSARTDSRRAESARNPIASHVKFGDDCANAQPRRSQWTAAFRGITDSCRALPVFRTCVSDGLISVMTVSTEIEETVF